MSVPVVARLLGFAVATVLLVAGLVLGFIAVVALRRSEGVFLPAGYVAVACLAAAIVLARALLR